MKKLELVVHVFSEQIPAYAKMFTAQLSGIALYPPKKCEVTVTVWTAETDSLTAFVVDRFAWIFKERGTPATLRLRTLQKTHLFRRAIGRNISAKECEADVQWMNDGDYVGMDGCLDSIAAIDFEAMKPAEMTFPKYYFMQETHAHGDEEIRRIVPGEIFETDRRYYFKKRLKLGIGGLQILPREFARRGYLDGTKWIKPRKDDRPFPDTDDDARFRRTIHSSVPSDIVNLYRMRHSATSYEDVSARALRMSKKPKPGRA